MSLQSKVLILQKKKLQEKIIAKLEKWDSSTQQFFKKVVSLPNFSSNEIEIFFQEYMETKSSPVDLRILKELIELGIPLAELYLKKEILKRVKKGDQKELEYLYHQGFLDYFSFTELKNINNLKLPFYFRDRVKPILEQIRHIKGVEHAVLVQRDGNPIEVAGRWNFENDALYNIITITCAIYNVGIYVFPDDLKFLLIEGRKAKLLIAPLQNPSRRIFAYRSREQDILDEKPEFLIAVIMGSYTNLGKVFMQMFESTKEIELTLELAGDDFHPTVGNLTFKNYQNFLGTITTKEEQEIQFTISKLELNLSNPIFSKIKEVLYILSQAIPDLKYAFLTIEGGFIATKILKEVYPNNTKIDEISARSYSLLQVANRGFWILKKMEVDSISCIGTNYFSFISNLKKVLFSAHIKRSEIEGIDPGKQHMKIGKLKLILTEFSKILYSLLEKVI